jgi:hypothetical protein
VLAEDKMIGICLVSALNRNGFVFSGSMDVNVVFLG